MKIIRHRLRSISSTVVEGPQGIALIGATGVLLSAMAYWVFTVQLEARHGTEFEWVARERVRSIEHELAVVLKGMQFAFGSGSFAGHPSEAGFQTIGRALLEQYPAMRWIAWYSLQRGGRVADPKSSENVRLPARFLEFGAQAGESDNPVSNPDPTYRALLLRALARGGLSVSGFPHRGRDGSEHFGFLVCVPVYSVSGTPEAGPEPTGFALALFHLKDLVQVSVGLLEPRGIDVSIEDASGSDPKRLLAFYASRLDPNRHPTSQQALQQWRDDAALRLSQRIGVGDQQWTVTAAATSAFRSAEAFEQGPAFSLSAGLLFTMVVVYTLMRMRHSLLARRQAEHDLRERDRLYTQMAETIDQVIWALDVGTDRLIYLSPACERVWGGSCEAIKHRASDLLAQLPAGDRKRLAAAARRMLQEPGETEIEFRLPSADEGNRWVRTRAFPVLDDRGGLCRVVGFSEDVTTRKLAEKALSKSERKLRTLFNQSPDVIMTVDGAGRILLLNRSVAGVKAGRAEGRDSAEIMPEESRERFRSTLKGVMEGGRIGHFRYVLPDATCWEVRIVPIKQRKRVRAAMVVCSDVTEKRGLEEQTMRNARLASVGALSAGVAHEVNNPNTVILQNASLLRRVWQDALPILDAFHAEEGDFSLGGIPFSEFRNRSPRLLDDLVGNSHRITRIVDNLKALSRQGSEGFEQVFDITDTLRQAANSLRDTVAAHTRHFSLELPTGLPPVKGNAQLLEQVFENLILNALQALPEPSRAVHIEAGREAETRFLWVCITDQGVGIAAADLNRVTEPFFTTRSAVGGSGLGLSISKSILERHGATMTFAPLETGGTRVTVRLPMQRNSEPDHGP